MTNPLKIIFEILPAPEAPAPDERIQDVTYKTSEELAATIHKGFAQAGFQRLEEKLLNMEANFYDVSTGYGAVVEKVENEKAPSPKKFIIDETPQWVRDLRTESMKDGSEWQG